jgi:predicted ATP-grasp superfamily ATP-dependent carboligase
VRALGRAGIPVFVADSSWLAPARWSKYATRRLTCPTTRNVERYLEWLLAFGAACPGTALSPTSDELAWLFAANLPALQRDFRVVAPPLETLLEVLDKRRLHEACLRAGIPTLPGWFPADEGEVDRLSREIAFPVVVKPRTQLFHRTNSKGGIATDARSLRDLWRALVGSGCTEPGLRRSQPELAEPFVQAYAPGAGAGVLSLSGFVDRSGEVFVVRAARKVLLRPLQLSVGVWFEAAAVDPALAQSLRRLCRQVGYFGVFEAEFVSWKGSSQLIDFNPRFYGEMGFDQARGLPLAHLAYLTALGDDAAVRELAQQTNDEVPVGPFVHGLALGIEAKVLSLRRAPAPEQRSLAAAREKRNGPLLDFVRDDDDPFPALLDAGNIVAQYFRHPRSLIRLLRNR